MQKFVLHKYEILLIVLGGFFFCVTNNLTACATSKTFNTFPGFCFANNTYNAPTSSVPQSCLTIDQEPQGFNFSLGFTTQTWYVVNPLNVVPVLTCDVNVTVFDNESPGIGIADYSLFVCISFSLSRSLFRFHFSFSHKSPCYPIYLFLFTQRSCACHITGKHPFTHCSLPK